MAVGRKCYCCGINEPVSPELFYCKPCLLLLSEIFKNKSLGILEGPRHYDHCISCGEWEGRQILYTGRTGRFPSHPGDGVPICDHCVEEELKSLSI